MPQYIQPPQRPVYLEIFFGIQDTEAPSVQAALACIGSGHLDAGKLLIR